MIRTNFNKEPPKKKKKKKNKLFNSNLDYESFSTTKNINIIKREVSKNKESAINNYKITYFSKYSNQIIIQNINSEKNYLNNNNLPKISDNNNIIIKSNFNEYLATDPNEMDFEDALEKDKRKFFEYFWELLKEKQLIINSFFINDNIKPKSIKIILFNGLLFSVDYLVELYNSEKDENFLVL